MPLSNLHTLAPADFAALLKSLMIQVEGNKELPYFDSAAEKKVTVGIGFNVQVPEVLRVVAEQMNLSIAQRNALGAATWQTDDKDYTYSLVQVDAGQRNLVITVASGANTGTITIRNWADGPFGITLGADVLAPQTSATYSGDFGKQSSGGTYTVSDGNYTGSVFLPDAPDVITVEHVN